MKIQCKNISEIPILEFLLKHQGHWCNWYFRDERDVTQVFPPDLPDKLILAKMSKLMKRKLIDGCDCGCRGDFEITQKGIEYLKSKTNG